MDNIQQFLKEGHLLDYDGRKEFVNFILSEVERRIEEEHYPDLYQAEIYRETILSKVNNLRVK